MKIINLKSFIWAILVGEAVYALYIYALRSMFPYDYYFWAESPFLTNLLKIQQGAWVYSSPADANSFVYAPGLEFINYALLYFFKLQFFLPAHRLLNCLYGILAAGFGAAAVLELREKVEGELPHQTRKVFVFSCLVLFLVLSANPLFDIPHPDNLNCLFFALNIFLVLRGYANKNLRLLIGASCIGAVAILCKQTACLLSLVNCVALLLLVCQRPIGKLWPLFPIGLSVLVLGVFFEMPYAKFYTLDILSQQGISESDILPKTLELEQFFSVIPLLFLYVSCILWCIRDCNWEKSKRIGIVLLALVLCLVPALGAYYKIMGIYNNLIVVLFLFFILALPSLSCIESFQKKGSFSYVITAFSYITILLLCLMLMPLKALPPHDLGRYADQIQQVVSHASQDNKKVLLGHGVVALTQAGILAPPLDRANSVLELYVGSAKGLTLAKTQERVSEGYYDVIVLNTMWYPSTIVDAIQQHYTKTFTIPAVQQRLDSWLNKYDPIFLVLFIPWMTEWSAPYNGGLQSLAPETGIYEKVPPANAQHL